MDDLISRETAIDALILLQDHSDMPEDWHKGISAALSCIYRVPSVERKKGKWIKGVGENGVSTSLFCSECNLENRYWYEWNFCPNCGALMWEEEDDE